MVDAKNNEMNKRLFLVIVYFLLFPFGQLLRIETSIFDISITFHILDIIVGLSIPVVLFCKLQKHPLRKHFSYFWFICFLSLLLAVTRYPLLEVLQGSLYLLRFISYYFFFELVWNITNKEQKSINKSKIIFWLTVTLVVTGIFGWLQYLLLPDLRYLKAFGWDDHLYRLAGTILDPGFMGILMVFGFLISISNFLYSKKKLFLSLSLVFLITCLFTYARASYIALFAGSLWILFIQIRQMKLKVHSFAFGTLIIITALGGLIFLLPRTAGEGVRLERTNSIHEKFRNYRETLQIVSDFPVFGVGFDTLCAERVRRFSDKGESHSCSGSDSSFLLVLATTGVVGGVAFLSLISHIASLRPRLGEQNIYRKMFVACGIALLVHSLFLNSLFYPWVMGVMVILLAVSVE